MWRTTFQLPLKLTSREVQGDTTPVSFDVDLIAALRSIGLSGVPDPLSVRIVDRAGVGHSTSGPAKAIPAQFSPAFIERLPLEAPGTPPPTWICRFPAGLGAAVPDVVSMRGRVSFLWQPGSLQQPALEF